MSDAPTIDAELTPGLAWRGRDAAGTRVVLKKLPDDCLRAGQLHPAIARRLARLREVPLSGFVNILGVQRHPEHGVVLVSEYARGRPLDAVPLAGRRPYLAECRRLIEGLHRHGLVHGAIGPGNFIVRRNGRVRLIDPSPHLYDDPAIDLADLARLDPHDVEPAAVPAADGWHAPSLAAAVGLAVVAVSAAGAWAWHVARTHG